MRKVKAYKVTMLVIDFENQSESEMVVSLLNQKHLSCQVIDKDCVEIDNWSDDHPLNKTTTCISDWFANDTSKN